eukprot:2563385-Rhodomonas_salina.2
MSGIHAIALTCPARSRPELRQNTEESALGSCLALLIGSQNMVSSLCSPLSLSMHSLLMPDFLL